METVYDRYISYYRCRSFFPSEFILKTHNINHLPSICPAKCYSVYNRGSTEQLYYNWYVFRYQGCDHS